MTDVTMLLDDFDLVAARADGVADPGEVQAAAEAAKALRQRSGFIGDTLVVALAGGTGSGKSSVLNAFAGAEIASVSPVRPHTDFPLAWIPSDAGPGLERMLDELSIYERASHDAFPGLAILDLPDIDSIVEWHRTVVEDLLPRIDAVIWLFDPEKYRDPMLHEEFLQRLSRHGDQFLFVLNKVDRIARDELDAVVADLTTALREDGYT
ncbi:MAG: ATP-binding protein, partial [Acidimicrobiia bacterium]|nr:ATP-binding protein [Acidimicrobiia bacterium]